ncbi:MAG: hypothetical protein LBU28_08415 [Spirochaetaceae bacterium]|jgi:hypothetical protein|nr:hypothetical protein [Spirochaetaceae bacterium]
MRQKISSIIAFVCIAVYIISIGIAAYRIITGIREHRNLAEREFDDLADISSAAGILGFTTEPFREAVRDTLMKSRTLEGVIISGPGGINYTFERERGRAIAMAGDAPRFRVAFGLAHEPFFRPLRIEGLRNVTISAVPSTIDYERLTVILKFTLVPILGGLVIALVTLVVESLRGKPARAVSRRKRDDTPALEEGEPEKAFDDFDAPVSSGPDTLPGAGVAVREPYSPRGILWEDLTREWLVSELDRCTSLGEDMIFAVMEFRERAKVGERIFSRFVREAVDYFARPNLIFERGERGIAVIVPNITLDQLFSRMSAFRDQALERLGPPLEKRDLCIGMSSRAERSTDADRLVLEAQAALEKAREDPASPVVAFKSDPEKYRAFMASQTQRHP